MIPGKFYQINCHEWIFDKDTYKAGQHLILYHGNDETSGLNFELLASTIPKSLEENEFPELYNSLIFYRNNYGSNFHAFVESINEVPFTTLPLYISYASTSPRLSHLIRDGE